MDVRYTVEAFHPHKLQWVTIDTDLLYTEAVEMVRGIFAMGYIARTISRIV